MWRWSASVFVTLGLLFGIRTVVQPWFVESFRVDHQPRRQAMLEIILFMCCATMLGVFNIIVYDPPLYHIPRQYFIFLVPGAFVAMDMALQRERWVAQKLIIQGESLDFAANPGSVTKRFALAGSVITICIILIIFLLVSTDIYWMITKGLDEVPDPSSALIFELFFILALFLVLIINPIISYSKNLAIYFDNQNCVMRKVTEGDLNSRASVLARDEFGMMADYTNVMIKALKDRTIQLQQTKDVTIIALASLAETRDNETGAHLLRTQHYVRVLAERLSQLPKYAYLVSKDNLELMYKSAPLHDIGKVGVPDAILLKPARLTPVEFEIMKKHTTFGRDALASALEMLGKNSYLSIARDIAYTHHEYWDGSGYPVGLAGENIPVAGRLMALADVYDALISKRVYKPAFPHEKARTIILEGRGTHFDPDIVDAFIEAESEFKSIKDLYQDGEEIHLN